MHDPSFEGGVFSASIEGGRAGARLFVRSDGIHAETSDGARFHVPYASCQLELGGASGRMWFCRTPERDLTIFTEAPGFGAALRDSARRELGADLERIEAATKSGRKRAALLWLVGLATLALLALGGYYGIRQLGRASVDVLPTSVDDKLGELALQSMSLEGRELDDPVLAAALKEIVDRLAKQAGPGFKFRVQVREGSLVNAFALPGGHIVVYTGLLRAADAPEQLAGVLAHEMAHVTRRHGMRRIAQSIGVVAAIQLLFGDVTGLMAVAVEVLREGTINSYSREQEHEADMDGVQTLARAKVDPRALASFFALLERGGDGSLPSVLSWISTHPDLRQRIADVEREADRLGPTTPRPFSLSWPDVQQHAGGKKEAAE